MPSVPEVLAADASRETFFDAPPFLEALAEAWAPGAEARLVELAVDGRRYRAVEAGGRLLADVAFVDLHAPLGPATGAERPLSLLGNAVVEVVPAEVFLGRLPEPGFGAAPFVDWARFPRWADFEASVKARQRNTFSEARRRLRRLEEEVGPVALYLHHPAPELLELALTWKRDQYRRTGAPDFLAPRRNADLFRALWRRGLLQVAVLRAGTRPAAIHLGATWQGRFHYWMPVYDPALSRYGPGRLLLHHLLEASHHAGDRSFEFLYGDEDYKWHYATDVRVVGPVGHAPLASRLWSPVRHGLAAAVRASPPAWSLAQRTRRYLVEHGVL